MDQQEMIAVVEQHLKAEGAGDVEGAVSVYTDDIVHDDVGSPGSPRTGKDAAREFYRFLTANFRTEGEEPLNRFFDGDNMILEQAMTGTVIGEMLGIPGHGRRVSFRILHVFSFRDGLISREQVWIDSGAIVAQLTAHSAARLGSSLNRLRRPPNPGPATSTRTCVLVSGVSRPKDLLTWSAPSSAFVRLRHGRGSGFR